MLPKQKYSKIPLVVTLKIEVKKCKQKIDIRLLLRFVLTVFFISLYLNNP